MDIDQEQSVITTTAEKETVIMNYTYESCEDIDSSMELEFKEELLNITGRSRSEYVKDIDDPEMNNMMAINGDISNNPETNKEQQILEIKIRNTVNFILGKDISKEIVLGDTFETDEAGVICNEPVATNVEPICKITTIKGIGEDHIIIRVPHYEKNINSHRLNGCSLSSIANIVVNDRSIMNSVLCSQNETDPSEKIFIETSECDKKEIVIEDVLVQKSSPENLEGFDDEVLTRTEVCGTLNSQQNVNESVKDDQHVHESSGLVLNEGESVSLEDCNENILIVTNGKESTVNCSVTLDSCKTNFDRRHRFKCKFCSYACDKKTKIINHHKLHTVFNLPIKKCTNCEFKSTKHALRSHFYLFHSDTARNGTRSNTIEKTRTASNVINHINDFKCKFCSYSCDRKGRLSSHTKLHTVLKLPIMKCKRCSFKSTRHALRKHWEVSHRNTCDKNVTTTTNKESLDEVNGLSCKYCSYISKRKREITSHMKLHTVLNLPIMKCGTCEFKSTKRALIKHQQSCRKSMLTTASNENNEAVNLPEVNFEVMNPYTCKFCSYSSKQKGSISRHLKVHTVSNMPIMKCDICEFKSTKQALLKHKQIYHKKLHTTTSREISESAAALTSAEIDLDKRFTCKFCSYASKTKSKISRHMRVHTVSKLPIMKCDKCDFKSTKHALSKHQQLCYKNTATKEVVAESTTASASPEIDLGHDNRFTCKFCSYSNKERYKILRHLRVHTVSKLPIMKCDKCDFKSTKRALFEHQQNCHKNIATKDVVAETTAASASPEIDLDHENLFTCKFCSYSNKERYKIERHLTVHTVSKLPIMQCPECDFKSIKQALFKHQQLCHKNTNTVPTRAANLAQTNLNHINCFTCKFCSYTNTKKARMSVHTRLHTVYNLPIMKCTNCDFKSTKLALLKHQRVCRKNIPTTTTTNKGSIDQTTETSSTDNKNCFTCKFCSYTNKTKGKITRHMKAHTVSKSPIMECDKCNFKSTKQALASHWKSHHATV